MWCATKLDESQKVASTICITLKSSKDSCSKLVVMAKGRGDK
jgi:hypothetical protein